MIMVVAIAVAADVRFMIHENAFSSLYLFEARFAFSLSFRCLLSAALLVLHRRYVTGTVVV
jgi:hypothetical protein